MPTFDFKCEICGDEIEEFLPLGSEVRTSRCICGGRSVRQMGSPRVIWNGPVRGRENWNGPTTVEIIRQKNDSPEVKSGDHTPKGSRWV
jgi:putative FmdB family regulatory protein